MIFATGIPNPKFACDNLTTIVNESKKNGVDPMVVISMVYQDSKWEKKSMGKFAPTLEEGIAKLANSLNLFINSSRSKRKRYLSAICTYKRGFSVCRNRGNKHYVAGMSYAVFIKRRAEFMRNVYDGFEKVLLEQ